MTSDELMTLIKLWFEAEHNSVSCQIDVEYQLDPAAREWQYAQAQRWHDLAAQRLRDLERAVQAAFPAQATVEGFMPVRALPGGKVELRAINTAARPVSVIFTGTEALNLGGRLTACGAVALDRIGFKLDAELRPVSGDRAIGTAPVPPPVVPGSAPTRQR